MRIILLLFLGFAAIVSQAQTLDELDEALTDLDADSAQSFTGEGEIFYKYRISPKPKMSETQFFHSVNEYVKENYPENTQLFGRVNVEFIVEPDGRLTNFSVFEGLNPEINQVVIDAVKSVGDWEPGMNGVVNVRCYKKQPIMVDKDLLKKN